MKHILLFLLFTPQAFALEVILDRTNHMGLRTTDILIQESSRFIFNGKDLGTPLPPEVLRSFKELTQLPQESNFKAACASGTFVYLKKENKKEIRRTGCTEGVAYGQLIKKIETLRKFAKRK